jgi:hypothetical protein
MKKLTTRDTMSTNQESGQAILRTGSAGRDGVRQTASMTHSQILTKLSEVVSRLMWKIGDGVLPAPERNRG